MEIVNTFLEKLKGSRLDDISIKDVCAELMISEGTFFNYFPKKSDLLEYYISVWSVYVNHCAQQKIQTSALQAIEEIFYCTADMMKGKTAIMAEIIAHIARGGVKPHIKDLSDAEKLAAYPKINNITKSKATDLAGLFTPLLEKAVKNGEIPQDTNIRNLLTIIKSIFFGSVIAVDNLETQTIKTQYQNQLILLWKSLK